MSLQLVSVTEKPRNCLLYWAIIPGSLYIANVSDWSVYDVQTGADYYLVNERKNTLECERWLYRDGKVYEFILSGGNIELHCEDRTIASVGVPICVEGEHKLQFNTDHNGRIHVVFSTYIIELAIDN